MIRQTWYPRRAATLETCEADLQPPSFAEVVVAVLPELAGLLEQAATASPRAAVAAAALVSVLNVFTGIPLSSARRLAEGPIRRRAEDVNKFSAGRNSLKAMVSSRAALLSFRGEVWPARDGKGFVQGRAGRAASYRAAMWPRVSRHNMSDG